MTMTASSTPEEGNVSVVVRARPPNRRELEGNHHSVLQVVDHSMLVFDPEGHDTSGVFSSLRGHDGPKRKGKDLKFIFDHVFGESSKQQDVFEHTTKQVLDGVLNGYNCSVFAYGATGSGKTHTMLGSETEPGVMYLTMIELYRRIDAIKEEKLCEVLISYLEVYNEQIEDLLEPRGPLAIREDPQKGVVVQGLSFHQPKSAEQLLQMLASGNLNRTQHPTDANATSSRSHAVFQIYVKQQDRVASISQDVLVAKMSLIDLAGSERASSTNAKGERLREGANINRSLLALINVINALADAKSRKAHIPYRDSKLTRLLKDSIGGNCRTVMIAAVSPSSLSYDDTYNTLKYANRAKEIKLSLKSNVINLDCHISKYAAVCEELKAEVDDLKAKLRSYERKEIGLQQPNDVPACHSPEHQTSPRLEEPPDTGSSEQGYKTRLRVLGSRSSCQCRDQKRLGQRFKKNREKPDPVSQNSSLGGAEQEKGLSFLEGPSGKRTDRLVGALLQVVRKQWEILKCANLQTPEMDTELQELELLALGSPSINHVKKIEKEQKTEVCEAEASKTLGEENLQLPAMEGVVSVDKQESNIAPVTPIRKRQPVKRCWQELLPDVGPTLGSPVVPAKRRRQTEASTSSKANGSALSSTPDVQIKRPRKTSIPSRSQPALRPSAGLLSRKTSQPPPSQPKLKQSSHCTTKYTMQKTPNLLLNPTKSRVPLGTSAMQNHTSVPVTAQAANDLNTTFDMSEECCLAPELNKTVIFGTSGFPGWENVGVQHMDSTFGKSSDVTVFTMKGLSVKRPNATQMAPATKSYSLRRRRSISTSTSRAVNGTLSNSHIVRLHGTTVKKIQQPKTIAENISCSPRGQSGKRTGRGAVAFGRSLPAAPMTRFMQSLSQKCIV